MKVNTALDIEFVALELHELEVTEPREDFELEVKRATQAARAGTVGDVARARALYRRFGVDPTRVRPSSEALLRRLKKGDPLPRINSLVDVANAMSVQLRRFRSRLTPWIRRAATPVRSGSAPKSRATRESARST